MAQPTFFLQPLAAAISLACFSSVVFAAEVDSAHILAPIVVTAQQGNDAHGLIVHANPKQPTQPIPAVDGAAYLQSIVGFNQIKKVARMVMSPSAVCLAHVLKSSQMVRKI